MGANKNTREHVTTGLKSFVMRVVNEQATGWISVRTQRRTRQCMVPCVQRG